MLRRAWSAAALVWLMGCPAPLPSGDAGSADGGSSTDGGSADAGASDGGGSLDTLCSSQHTEAWDGGTLIVCDQLYATPPYIRPPADSTDGNTGTAYVGCKLVATDGGGFAAEMVGRGEAWSEPTGFSSIIEGSTSGNAPYGTLLYRAGIQGGSVSSLEPIARIDEALFLQPFVGRVLEGSLSPRVVNADGGVSFDFQNLDVPVRIVLDATVSPPNPGTGGHPFLGGTIENVDAGVLSSTGTCLPSLESWDGGDPVFGQANPGQLTFFRDSDMHGNHDDVIVMLWSSPTLGSTMTPGGYIAVADLLQSTPFDLSAFGGGFTHGTPSESPSATGFSTVDGGGAFCP